MSTAKVSVYSDEDDLGYLKNMDWWYDIDFPDSYTIFDTDTLYPDRYYADGHGITSAMVEERYHFVNEMFGDPLTSIADIGVSCGQYLKIFQDHDIEAFGVDGSKASLSKCKALGIYPNHLIQVDLRLPVDLGRKFDIIMCNDIAEHIEPPFAGMLIYNITKHSDFILFSAETDTLPNEPHYHHCNEMPYKYWENLFKFFDFVRVSHSHRQDWLLFKRQS